MTIQRSRPGLWITTWSAGPDLCHCASWTQPGHSPLFHACGLVCWICVCWFLREKKPLVATVAAAAAARTVLASCSVRSLGGHQRWTPKAAAGPAGATLYISTCVLTCLYGGILAVVWPALFLPDFWGCFYSLLMNLWTTQFPVQTFLTHMYCSQSVSVACC